MPLPLTIGTGRALLGAPGILDQIRALALSISASSRWWQGDDATLSAWVDRLQGTSAAAAGSGTTIGSMGGRACPVFNGSGRYATSAFGASVTQPYTSIAVVRNDSGTLRSVIDGIVAGNRGGIFGDYTTTGGRVPGGYSMHGGTERASTTTDVAGVAVVLRAAFSGASSRLLRNGTAIIAADAGAHALSGLVIAANWAQTYNLIGAIGAVLILPDADAENVAAAQIARLLQSYYGIS